MKPLLVLLFGAATAAAVACSSGGGGSSIDPDAGSDAGSHSSSGSTSGSTSSSGGSGSGSSSGSGSGGASGSSSGGITCSSADPYFCACFHNGAPANATPCAPSALQQPGACCADPGWPASGTCQCASFTCDVNAGGGYDCWYHSGNANH